MVLSLSLRVRVARRIPGEAVILSHKAVHMCAQPVSEGS